jgi:hypothetical protein
MCRHTIPPLSTVHRPILTIRTITPVITRGWDSPLGRVSRGARIGEITGAIAIGATATSTLTTTTILTAIIGTITIAPARAGIVRAIGPARAIDRRKCRGTGNGDTIHHTAATRRTEIAEQTTNLVKLTTVPARAEIVDKPAIGQAQVVEEHNVRAAVHLQNQAAVEARHQLNPAAEKDQRVDPAVEEAVPVRDHPLVHPAEITWAIARRRRATMEIAAADTVVRAAEIMRARAVIAAVAAWAAADTAVVVAVADLVAAGAAVGEVAVAAAADEAEEEDVGVKTIR